MKTNPILVFLQIFALLAAVRSLAASADLSATLVPSQSSVTEGSNITFTATVTNLGPNGASGVLAQLRLPGFVITQSATTQGTLSGTPDGIICNIPGLSVDAGATVTVNGFFGPGDTNETRTVTNRVEVSAQENDPVSANNVVALPVIVIVALDFGDAPGGYVSCLPGGARHRIVQNYRLGAQIDAEANCQPNDNLAGLADEDGIVFNPPPPWLPGTVVNVTVNYVLGGAPGVLEGWLDFYGVRGVFDPADHIFPGLVMPAVGPMVIGFTVPATAAGPTWARFRLSKLGVAGPGGYAPDGEVEDYPMGVLQQNNLAIAQKALPNPVAVSNDLTFMISVTNLDNSTAASGVIVTDTLPANVTFVSATFNNQSVSNNNGTVIFDIGTVSNAPVEMTVVVRPNNPPGGAEAATVTNRVQVVANEVDPDLANNFVALPVLVLVPLDFGDAPEPAYPTLRASNGARHRPSQLFLGAAIDYELDGLPDPAAALDDIVPPVPDDEDGVLFLNPLFVGGLVNVQVVASGPGMLDGWIDFNRNANWDAAEQVFVSVPVAAGPNALSFTVPPGVPTGYTFARFRLSSGGGLAPTGPANNGEVEDYRVYVRAPVPLPHLNFAQAGVGNQVSWDMAETRLERAPTVAGPWIPVPGAISPFTVPAEGQAGFFRLQPVGGPLDPGLMLREADLVFEGTAITVQTRNSDTNETHDLSVPHTFVTFQVHEVLKGSVTGGTICLRFAGGPGAGGLRFSAHHSTWFDPGERSLLFVTRNGGRATPLVHGKDGRFRVISGMMYTEDGAEVVWTREARLSFGEHQEFPEVQDDLVGNEVIHHVRVHAPGEGPEPAIPSSEHLSSARFKSILNSFLQHTHSPAELANPAPAATCDFNAPFFVPSPIEQPFKNALSGQ